jgi:hypothetical protein
MNFEIISEITDIEIVAKGTGIDDITAVFDRLYGNGDWRSLLVKDYPD